MRRIILIFVLLVSFWIYAEAQDNSYGIGLLYQPFVYYNYSKSAWNNSPATYPVSPDGFNGYAVGIKYDQRVNKNIRFFAELAYSRQNQKYIGTTWSIIRGESDVPYNTTMMTEFKILKLPVSISLSSEVGINSNLFISAYLGIQNSVLLDYLSIYRAYYSPDHQTIDWDIVRNEIIRTPRQMHQIFFPPKYDPDNYQITDRETDYLYSRYLIGVLGGLEIKKVIYSKVSFGLGGRFEYDLNNSNKSYTYFFGMEGNNEEGEGWTKAPTPYHNVRMGLSFNIMYLID